MKLSNCITDDLPIMHQLWYADAICLFMFLMIFLTFNVFINIHVNANYVD